MSKHIPLDFNVHDYSKVKLQSDIQKKHQIETEFAWTYSKDIKN